MELFFFLRGLFAFTGRMLFPQDGFFSGITDMYFDVRFVRCVERHDRHDTLAASEFQPVGGHGCFSGSNTLWNCCPLLFHRKPVFCDSWLDLEERYVALAYFAAQIKRCEKGNASHPAKDSTSPCLSHFQFHRRWRVKPEVLPVCDWSRRARSRVTDPSTHQHQAATGPNFKHQIQWFWHSVFHGVSRRNGWPGWDVHVDLQDASTWSCEEWKWNALFHGLWTALWRRPRSILLSGIFVFGFASLRIRLDETIKRCRENKSKTIKHMHDMERQDAQWFHVFFDRTLCHWGSGCRSERCMDLLQTHGCFGWRGHIHLLKGMFVSPPFALRTRSFWYPFSKLLPPISLRCDVAPFLFVSKLQWGDGELDADRFVEGCMRLKGTARSMDVSLVLQEQRRLRKKILSILAAISAKSP